MDLEPLPEDDRHANVRIDDAVEALELCVALAEPPHWYSAARFLTFHLIDYRQVATLLEVAEGGTEYPVTIPMSHRQLRFAEKRLHPRKPDKAPSNPNDEPRKKYMAYLIRDYLAGK